MYLRSSPARLERELQLAREGGYVFAAKIVRGAYMDSERLWATRRGRSDPIWPSVAATSASYHAAVEKTLAAVREDAVAEVMIATHNVGSVEYATRVMSEASADTARVHFAQLFGMKDYITYALGAAGFQAYK